MFQDECACGYEFLSSNEFDRWQRLERVEDVEETENSTTIIPEQGQGECMDIFVFWQTNIHVSASLESKTSESRVLFLSCRQEMKKATQSTQQPLFKVPIIAHQFK